MNFTFNIHPCSGVYFMKSNMCLDVGDGDNMRHEDDLDRNWVGRNRQLRPDLPLQERTQYITM